MRLIDEVKGILFDLDGVLWLGDQAIPGVAGVLHRLRARGKKLMFVSNTSSRSKAKCLQVFERMGVDVDPDEVFIASECAARYIAARKPGAVTYVLGSPGLFDEAVLAGLDARTTSTKHPEQAEYVMVGKDNDLTFTRLTCALRALKAGAKFVAVNCDPTVPVADGLEPGAGALAAAMTFMTGREPDVVVGKPGTLLLEMALERCGLTPAECAMVGDTPESDVAAGNALGMHTILVLTGNSDGRTADDDLNIPAVMRPELTLQSVLDLDLAAAN
ncbi:MAG: putative hydrolase YutF [Firmicutes bacterium ADurb.Bin506]|nr:MAG: putative hydrolase YutF [Firmicutes bacterium ADurb.Bin506]